MPSVNTKMQTAVIEMEEMTPFLSSDESEASQEQDNNKNTGVLKPVGVIFLFFVALFFVLWVFSKVFR